MTEPTLGYVRAQIDALAVDVGRYAIMCARTGEHPVPIGGLRFPDRETATRAARVAQYYRKRLRRYDSHVACHDLIVYQDVTGVRRRKEHTKSEPNWYRRFRTDADYGVVRSRAMCGDNR